LSFICDSNHKIPIIYKDSTPFGPSDSFLSLSLLYGVLTSFFAYPFLSSLTISQQENNATSTLLSHWGYTRTWFLGDLPFSCEHFNQEKGILVIRPIIDSLAAEGYIHMPVAGEAGSWPEGSMCL
jgi:hypothetical protein